MHAHLRSKLYAFKIQECFYSMGPASHVWWKVKKSLATELQDFDVYGEGGGHGGATEEPQLD